MKVTQTLWFCQDCTIAAVNDDYTGFRSEADIVATVTGLNRLGPNVCSDDNDESGTIDFSRGPCDCCRSPLAGSRHRFAILSDD